MKKNFSLMVSLLTVLLTFCVTACSDDTDDTLFTDISGTAWRITSSTDFDFSVGSVIEFHKDGNVTMSNWGAPDKWKVKNGNLIIISNTDQTNGTLKIDGETAIYEYHWEGVYDDWVSEQSHTLELQRL
ncbi:MAG: hypothetical protein K2N91_04485 [Muribaculaceae bacterium]|nr:hypothetical protein [Muribaculaceae bacterium]